MTSTTALIEQAATGLTILVDALFLHAQARIEWILGDHHQAHWLDQLAADTADRAARYLHTDPVRTQWPTFSNQMLDLETTIYELHPGQTIDDLLPWTAV